MAHDISTNPILNGVEEERERVAASSTDDKAAKLAVIQDTIARNEAAAQVVSQQLESNLASENEAHKALISSIESVAANNQIKNTISANAAMEVENLTSRAITDAGAVEKQAALFSQYVGGIKTVDALQDRIDDIQDDTITGIGLIDGVINDFRSEGTHRQLNTAIHRNRQTARRISTITRNAEDINRTAALSVEHINEGLIQANNEIIGATAAGEIAKADIINIHANSNARARQLDMNARQLMNKVREYEILDSIESKELQREGQRLTNEKLEMQRKAMPDTLKKLKADAEIAAQNAQIAKRLGPAKEAASLLAFQESVRKANAGIALENQVVSAVNAGESSLGKALTPKETILNGINRSGPQGDALRKAQEIGNSRMKVLGITPFESIENITIASPSGNITQTPALKVLREIMNQQEELYASTVRPKDRDAQMKDFNDTAMRYLGAIDRDVKPGSGRDAPGVDTLLSSYNVLRNTEFYKLVIEPASIQKLNEPNLVMEKAMAAIRSGAISPEAVSSGLGQFYNAAADFNNMNFGGFNRLGLLSQKTYNTRIHFSAGFVPPASINLFTSPGTFRKTIQADTEKFAIDIRGKGFIMNLMDINSINLGIAKMLLLNPVTAPVDSDINK